MPIAPTLLSQVANPPAAQVQGPDYLSPALAVFQQAENAKKNDMAKREFELRRKKFDAELEKIAREETARKRAEETFNKRMEEWDKSSSLRDRAAAEIAEAYTSVPFEDAKDYVDMTTRIWKQAGEDIKRQREQIEEDKSSILGMNAEQRANYILKNDMVYTEDELLKEATMRSKVDEDKRKQELQQKVTETRATTRAREEEQQKFKEPPNARLTEFKANDDVTLPGGQTIRAGQTFRLDQNNRADAEFAKNAGGSITRIGVAGASADAGDFSGSKAGELSDALESGEASNLLREYTELGGGVSGLRGQISEHVGGPVGQVFGPGAEKAFTQFVSNADPQQITNWRTRARSFVTRQITEFTGEESGRITKAELDLTRQAQKVVDDPKPSEGQVRAALSAVIELKEVSRLKNRLMRGSAPRFDLTTKEGLNEYGNLLIEKGLTKPEAEAMLRRMQTIQRDGLSALGGFVTNG